MGNFEERESTSGFLYLLVHFSHSWTTCSKTHCGNPPMKLTLCRSMLGLPKKWFGIQISLDSYLNCKTCCMNLGCPLWFHNFLMWFLLPPQNACKDQRVWPKWGTIHGNWRESHVNRPYHTEFLKPQLVSKCFRADHLARNFLEGNDVHQCPPASLGWNHKRARGAKQRSLHGVRTRAHWCTHQCKTQIYFFHNFHLRYPVPKRNSKHTHTCIYIQYMYMYIVCMYIANWQENHDNPWGFGALYVQTNPYETWSFSPINRLTCKMMLAAMLADPEEPSSL